MVTSICQAADKQLLSLVEWAKRIPSFTTLPLDDQVTLLRSGMSTGVFTYYIIFCSVLCYYNVFHLLHYYMYYIILWCIMLYCIIPPYCAL